MTGFLWVVLFACQAFWSCHSATLPFSLYSIYLLIFLFNIITTVSSSRYVHYLFILFLNFGGTCVRSDSSVSQSLLCSHHCTSYQRSPTCASLRFLFYILLSLVPVSFIYLIFVVECLFICC